MALRSAIVYAEEPDMQVVRKRMNEIGENHSRAHMNVRPEWYPIWLDSMIHAVEECDPHFSESLGDTWRIVLTPAIDLIISKYDEAV